MYSNAYYTPSKHRETIKDGERPNTKIILDRKIDPYSKGKMSLRAKAVTLSHSKGDIKN